MKMNIAIATALLALLSLLLYAGVSAKVTCQPCNYPAWDGEPTKGYAWDYPRWYGRHGQAPCIPCSAAKSQEAPHACYGGKK